MNKTLAQQLRDIADQIENLESKPEEYWTIKIPKGLTIEKAFADCKELFDFWRWTDDNLDQIINSDRTSSKGYSVKVRASFEPDEEYRGMSADDIKAKGLTPITLLEYLVLAKDVFKKTGKHLDEKYITLCAGSRTSDGVVPSAFWYRGWRQAGLSWGDSGGRDGYFGVRVAVKI